MATYQVTLQMTMVQTITIETESEDLSIVEDLAYDVEDDLWEEEPHSLTVLEIEKLDY